MDKAADSASAAAPQAGPKWAQSYWEDINDATLMVAMFRFRDHLQGARLALETHVAGPQKHLLLRQLDALFAIGIERMRASDRLGGERR